MVLKISILILVVMQMTQAVLYDKWHECQEFGRIFIEEEQKYNWFEAWNECAIRNMTLIAVDTAERNPAIDTILRKKFTKCPNLWIGGNDLGEEGTFIWSSTGNRFEFSNWQKGQPDNYKNNEHCVHYYTITDFEWNDAPCSSKMGFICEENRFWMAARRDLNIKKNFIDQLFAL
ncbi:lectin subunit alpha-like [Haematobia irritans]|uniref:lectin subunit alpha-like n=1 Tax=Haematobia irritans TaxID=7368 RepID=UPI003F4F8DCF